MGDSYDCRYGIRRARSAFDRWYGAGDVRHRRIDSPGTLVCAASCLARPAD